MQNEKLENLKEKIRKAYQEEDLKALAECFNISVDESRIEDYCLVDFDFNKPAAQFLDKKNNTIYYATFNSPVRWFNGNNNGIPYNYVVTIINHTYRKEALYNINSDRPFVERIIFSKDDYDLVVQKKSTEDGEKELMVQYLKNVEYEGRRVQQELLTKIYGKHLDSEEQFAYDFEQLFTYMTGTHRYIDYKDSEDTYFYNIKNENIIYGINEYEKGNCSYLYGLCLERGDVNIGRYLPLNIRSDEFPELNENPKSACVFKCWIDGIRHKLGIYVNPLDKKWHTNMVKIKHYADRFNESCEGNFEVLDDSEIEIPGWTLFSWPEGGFGISSKISSLYGDNDFTKLINEQLTKFCSKITERDNKVCNEHYYFNYVSLNPRLLIDKPLEDIAKHIIAKADEYFGKINAEFCEHANIPEEEPVVKQLTPKK